MANRAYSYSDALMLSAGKVVIAHLRTCIRDLSEVRSAWTRSYTTNLEKRINASLFNTLFFDPKDIDDFVRYNIYSSVQHVIKQLTLLKLQVEFEFRHDPQVKAEYLTLLGFDGFSEPLNILDEGEVIDLLNTTAANVGGCVNRELMKHGINPMLLNGLEKSCNELNRMRAIQKAIMEYRQRIPDDGIDELNSIYEEISGICTIARAYYEGSPKKQRLFHLAEVVFQLEGVRPETFNMV